MKRRTRINYTPEQKVIIWDRYKQGDSLHDIPQNVRQISLYYHAYNPPGPVATVLPCESGTG